MNKPKILRFTVAAGLVVAVAGAGLNLSSSRNNSPTTPDKDPPLRLVLNVPAHKIFVFENGVMTKTVRVGVGMVGTETPAGSYKLTEAIWNPWWHPPASDWAAGRKPEAPGPTNPMGRVKMNFAPLLYIHGTHMRSGVSSDPSSHGCVHVLNEDVIELARLVHKYATPNLKSEVLDKLAANPVETREINFRNAIPFDVVYDVATVQNNYLYVYPDVYERVPQKTHVEQVREVLSDHGVEMDDARIVDLVERAHKTRIAVSLDELRASAPSAGTSGASNASGSKASNSSSRSTAGSKKTR